MGELERCFVCKGTIRPGYAAAACRRSAEPVWIDEVVCAPCKYRIKDLGTVLVEWDDEYWTVRLGPSHQVAAEEVGRQRSS